MAENQKLTTEELGALQVLNTNFQNTKIKIAECELQKVKLIAELDAFRKDFASMEKELINTETKYKSIFRLERLILQKKKTLWSL